MQVRHLKMQGDPADGSATERVWCYRTEVHNDHEVPVRVVWFNFLVWFGDCWAGINARNKVLREQDFEDWYSDGEKGVGVGGWLAPGATAVCDPNWQLVVGEEMAPSKWAFLAVDAKGNSYLGEGEVSQEQQKSNKLNN